MHGEGCATAEEQTLQQGPGEGIEGEPFDLAKQMATNAITPQALSRVNMRSGSTMERAFAKGVANVRQTSGVPQFMPFQN